MHLEFLLAITTHHRSFNNCLKKGERRIQIKKQLPFKNHFDQTHLTKHRHRKKNKVQMNTWFYVEKVVKKCPTNLPKLARWEGYPANVSLRNFKRYKLSLKNID